MGGGGQDVPGKYMHGWGNFSAVKQRGIITYGVAQNRQRPLAGTAHAAVFNVFRRTKAQILFWSIPMLIGYETMQWAIERNEFLNSKEGRALYAGQE